ncbi:MAG: hypothetical protein JO142_21250 [Burkholderiales bacterium]|nr:hypothetical protein [Burkholderiales bacterium]
MSVLYVSDVPLQQRVEIVAQAEQPRNSISGNMAVGLCGTIDSSPGGRVEPNSISPYDFAHEYLYRYVHRDIRKPAEVTVLELPSHGELKNFGSRYGYAYIPVLNYIGVDRFSVMVEMGGYRVKVVYFYHVDDHVLTDGQSDRLCSKHGHIWKISSIQSALHLV